ncbi:class I SAM-dependent methyltransferase [Dermatophilaceae bacterium Sec6.4]|nr:class I SAM-dependent methyltransferase [Actinomycetota bacterium]
MSQATAPLLSALDAGDLGTIKGWFNPSDRHLFEFLLGEQVRHEHHGELVEVGSFLGKSAVLVGHFRQPGETFTVLDLFEGEAGDAENTRELSDSYSGLTRSAFEANYLRFHPDLPTIVQATSNHIVQHVAPGSARFVHIDASHLYEHVATDVDSARLLLQPDGIVAFDDYRSEHTPGVPAAVWEAVATKDLRVIALTESKLYGTWGDPAAAQEQIQTWLGARGHCFCATHIIAGRPILRIKISDLPAPEPAPASTPPPVVAAPTAVRGMPRSRTGIRKVAKDWLPPIAHRAVSRRMNPPK